MKNNQKNMAVVLLAALLLTGCGQKEQMNNSPAAEITAITTEQTDTIKTNTIPEEGDPAQAPEIPPSRTAAPGTDDPAEAAAVSEPSEEAQPEKGAPAVETPAPAAQDIAPAPVSASSLSYGAIPFDLAAGTEQWWQIDAGDSAYWAVQENINAIRAAAGLGPLSMDAGLSAIAGARCQSFVAGGPFDHSGMVTDSEICASGPLGSASALCSAWQASPAHYAAMTGNFSNMGVGCWFCSTPEGNYTYWYLTFG